MANKLVRLKLPNIGELGLDAQNTGANDPRFAKTINNFVFDPKDRVLKVRNPLRVYKEFDTSDTGLDKVYNMFYTSDSNLSYGFILTGCYQKFYLYDMYADTWHDVTSAGTAPSGLFWNYAPFNNKHIIQQGANLWENTGLISHNAFTDVTTSGSYAPSSSCAAILSALGRLWVLDSNSLKFSDALDETSWNGVYDLSQYWGTGSAEGGGTDVGVALAEHLNYLVVFGKNNIIVYNTNLGATNLIKEKVISGTGCIARASIVHVNGDLWFLSINGMQSLNALLTNNPENSVLSKRAFDALGDLSNNSPNISYARAAYHQQSNAVYLVYETDVYQFDLNKPLGDGTFRIMRWTYDASDGGLYGVCCPPFIPDGYTATAQPLFFGGGYATVIDYDPTGTNDADQDWTDASEMGIEFDLLSTNINLDDVDPELYGKTKILKQWGVKYKVTTPDSTNKNYRMGYLVNYNGSDYSPAETKTMTASQTAIAKQNMSYSSDVFSLRFFYGNTNSLYSVGLSLYDYWVNFTVGKNLGYN